MKDDKKKKKTKVERKKKKVEDENINEESIESIDDADESFGLPDVDFKPLDEVEEPSGEPESEQEKEPEPEPETEQEKEPEPEPESEIESVDEVAAEETQKEDFAEDEGEFEDLEEGTYEPEDEKEDESQPVRTGYVPPRQPSVLPKILLGILGVIIVVAAVWFFGFYRPEHKALAEKAKKEALIAKQQEEAAKKAAEEARILEQQAAAEAEAAAEEESAQPEPGTISIITERTGRYYVVVGSFVDGDLANDYGNDLAAKGSGIMILSPPDKGFYRVALSDYSSWTEAQTNANGLKGDYGENVWVLKY